jgi:hypothetical protein
MEKRYVFADVDKDDHDTRVLACIDDTQGVGIYKLECHDGNYNDQSEMNFSGDFQCALFAVRGTTLASGNLLAAGTRDELSTDWWNRGRMRAARLRGECLKYPGYNRSEFQAKGSAVYDALFKHAVECQEGQGRKSSAGFIHG